MSIESVMSSSHVILRRPLLLPSIPPSIRVFSNESTLRMRWPKYWSFSFSIIPSKEHPARRDKKAFLSDQCKETEENNRMGKTRDLFKKIRDTKEHFMQRWGYVLSDLEIPWGSRLGNGAHPPPPFTSGGQLTDLKPHPHPDLPSTHPRGAQG